MPPDGQGWLLVGNPPAPRGSQGEAGVSWARARVSAKEPEISSKRQAKVPTGGEA